MRLKQDYHYKVFMQYIRHGVPMALSLKQETADNHSTPRYIWRTHGDGKVRESHQRNDGKIFSWDNPPPTGHPGEDYGCRCIAEPYVEEIDEYMNTELKDVADTGFPWGEGNFIWHYFNGNGEAVRLRDTGHLEKVVSSYWGSFFGHRVKKRLQGQIARTDCRFCKKVCQYTIL